MRLPKLTFEPRIKIITAGRIVLLLSSAFAVGASSAIVKWNTEYSVALVAGFVGFAQETISQYFDSGNGDPVKEKIALVLVLGYITLFGLALQYWNPLIGGQLITGFMLFARKLGKEYFKNSTAPAQSQISNLKSPITPTLP